MAVAGGLIEVRGAAFGYGDRTLFSSIDLDVFAGEVLTILGPNGCGKSTLLRCIGGALTVAAGTVRMGNQDLSALAPGARARRIGFLFQDHTPTFPFTVLDVVSMGRTPHMSIFGMPSPRDITLVEEALDAVDIRHLENRRYTELSGGERQLVLLARTLAQQPEVILLDEPTAHLDVRNQVLCLRTIGALAAQGRSMVMTTHDPNHAFLYPGRVVLMRPDGSLLTGPASDILTDTALSTVYGTQIGVFSVARRAGPGEIKFCSPWQ